MRFKSEFRKPAQPELVASRDPSRPVLTKIHLNAEASEVWVTDSYMAACFPVELDEGDTSGPIPVEALKAARKPPLPAFKGDTSIRVNGAVEVVMGHGEDASAPYVTMPRESGDYQFPNLAQLMPDDHADFEIGLNVVKLAALAKAMGTETVRLRFGSGVEAERITADGEKVRFTLPAPLRPIRVDPLNAFGEDAPRSILMPLRIAG